MTVYNEPKKNWGMNDIPDLTNKIAIVTGGTSGIGKEVARAFASHNAKVHLVARNNQKGEAVKKELVDETGNTEVYFHSVDLSSLKSISNFAESIQTDESQIDILINCAGLMMPAKRQVTDDGFELMWETNYLGPLYLTINLLPSLKKSSGARVVNLTSLPAGNPKVDLSNTDGHDYNAQNIYLETKLAQAQIARKLNQIFHEKQYPIQMMAANPGLAATNLVTKNAGATSTAMRVGAVIFRMFPSLRQSAQDGALPVLYAATDSNAQGGAVYSPNNRMNTKGYPALWKWNDKKEMEDPKILEELFERSMKLLTIDYQSSSI